MSLYNYFSRKGSEKTSSDAADFFATHPVENDNVAGISNVERENVVESLHAVAKI